MQQLETLDRNTPLRNTESFINLLV